MNSHLNFFAKVFKKFKPYGQRSFQSVYYATKVAKLKNQIQFSNGSNLLFIWIPKSAGTSLYTWLNRELGMVKLKEKEDIVGGFPQCGPVTFGHMDYYQLLEKGFVSEHFHKNAFKFAISRNPFDRSISLYSYLRKLGHFDMSFAAFLEMLENGVEPIGLYNTKGLSQANPQVKWITNPSGQLIVDRIFKLQELRNATSELSIQFGIRPFSVHTNKSNEKPDYLTAFKDRANVQRVKKIYQEDFDMLDYPDKPFL